MENQQTFQTANQTPPVAPAKSSGKKYLGLIIIIIIILAGIYYITRSNTNNLPTNSNNNQEQPIGAGEKTNYTLAQISEHATATDCWLAIDNKVYDVTAFIASGKHGGGDAILLGCGKDATELFEERPNGSGSHSNVAFSFLPQFEIGNYLN